jgi:hypothetical protein
MARMGYMGSATIGGIPVYLTGSSLNPVQQINAPDVVQGNVIKRVWNWGKVEVGGNCTGPLAQNMGGIWDSAIQRTNDLPYPIGGYDVAISYIEGGSRSFSGVHINTMEVSVTAGEVAQFSIDFLGAGYTGVGGGGGGGPSSTCVVLVTWDQCDASVSGAGGDAVQGASLNLNNNLERIYRLNQNDMNAYTVLAGFKEITGSVSYYADGQPGEGTASIQNCAQDTGNVSLSFGTKCGSGPSYAGVAAIQRAEASATTGPGIYTYNFTILAC